jgi:ubiquinone biosynthesis protein UbiJ
MSLPLLQTALLLPIEHLLNTLIRADAAGEARLAAMAGKVLAIRGESPAFCLYASVIGNRLRLAVVNSGPVDTTISGPASGMLKLLLARGEVHNLQPWGLSLTGDTGFMSAMQKLLMDLQVDWEYHLGRIIGDVPVQGLRDGLDHAGTFVSRAGSRFTEDLGEYLTEESGLLPTRVETEQLASDIAALILRIDRLEAGINHLGHT